MQTKIPSSFESEMFPKNNFHRGVFVCIAQNTNGLRSRKICFDLN